MATETATVTCGKTIYGKQQQLLEPIDRKTRRPGDGEKPLI